MDKWMRCAIPPLVLVIAFTLHAQANYSSTWESVDKHTPAPEWFKDAKFGIYFHWGVFSVPACSNEWYPRNMYSRAFGEYDHHLATYGDPKTDWPYHNFILGANDKQGVFTQFAPKLTSAGGNFDLDSWAALFDSAGAKFAGPVAEHHDGFSMWDSKVNQWNSVEKQPHLDLAGMFAKSIRARGMRFMLSMHHAFNFTGFYQWVPAQSDTSLKKLYGQLDSIQSEQLWLDKHKEVIDLYQPDLIWQDFNLNKISQSRLLDFLSYYYNKALTWNKEVVATYKDGFSTKGEVLDYERGGPGDISYPYWLTDDAVSSSSWSYTTGLEYYSTVQMMHSLIDRVSKNGNLLLNISPMADGTIPQEQRTILLGMGDWLRKFGTSIYATRAWEVYGEGPTKMGGGSFIAPVAGTNKDWRYTRTKDSTTLYAICLGWPGDGAKVTLTAVTPTRFAATGVELFGATTGEYFSVNNFLQSNGGVTFTLPATKPYSALAYAFKITSVNSSSIGHATPAAKGALSRTAGRICYGALPARLFTKEMIGRGFAVYTLQGKCLFRYRCGQEDQLIENSLAEKFSGQVYYVKYLP